MSYKKNKKRKNRHLVGLKMSWLDMNPQAQNPIDPKTLKISHRANSIPNNYAFDLWRDNADYLTLQENLHWSVKIISSFEFDKVTQKEERELIAYCALKDLSPYCDDALDEIFRHGVKERHTGTHFTIECLGKTKPKMATAA